MITSVILLITNNMRTGMGRSPRALIASMLVVLMLLSGCTSPDVDQPVLIGEELEGVENPCSQSTEPLAQSNTILNVGGVDRMFRLSIPSSDAGTELPILLAFHGEDMAEEEFPQQASFDALGEEHGFIMAYAVAEQGRTAAEGDWFLNTAATSADDIDFATAIVDALSNTYCVDQTRLYATGYALGSMLTYEIACQLNNRFAAVASVAGTMPIEPNRCSMVSQVAVMHIHGKFDFVVDYDEDWDWDEGEHEGVGTMSSVLGLIDSWAVTADCQQRESHYHMDVEHVVHSDCSENVLIEHHGIELHGHNWPDQVAGVETPEVIWEFLNQFSRA